jgi:hypothetical protein
MVACMLSGGMQLFFYFVVVWHGGLLRETTPTLNFLLIDAQGAIMWIHLAPRPCIIHSMLFRSALNDKVNENN